MSHVEKEEGDGWVEICFDNEVLGRHEDVQNNRNLAYRAQMLEEMAKQAIERYHSK